MHFLHHVPDLRDLMGIIGGKYKLTHGMGFVSGFTQLIGVMGSKFGC